MSYLSYDSDIYAGGGWIDSIVTAMSEFPGNEVAVLYVSGDRSIPWREGKIQYYPVRCRKSVMMRCIQRIGHIPEIVIDEKQVDRIIDDFSPEIIQLYGLETNIGSLVSHIRKIPVVVHIQGIMNCCIDAWYPEGYNKINVYKYSTLIDKLLFRTPADLYVRSCKLARNETHNFRIYRYYLGRTDFDKNCCHLLNPDSKYFHCDEILRKEFYCSKWHRHSGRTVISSVANGDFYKGYDVILKTAHLLKARGFDFEWNLYGEDDSFPLKRIYEKVEGLSFNACNVYFRGRKTASELAAALSDSSLFVHASHIDNSPNALCEAMMIGTPSIAVNVGGVSSIIKDGVDGFLVKDNDAEGLCDKIMELLSSETLMESISESSRDRALKRHNNHSIVMNLMEIYKNILNTEQLW